MTDRRTSAAVPPTSQAPSNSSIHSPTPIPPAPPPPPPKIKSRSYFERFVAQPLTTAYGSRPPSVQANPQQGGPPNVLVPKFPGVRTGYSQDTSHKTGLDISALDINRQRTHAVLAGKEILKTVRVQDAKIVDETNLRAAVLNYADSHARQREGLSIHDVKWSHGQFSSHIATAAANGKVILYDLNRASVELTRLHEHTRQVHKLAFNPHQGYLLLSASHDGTVRLWDLRDMRREITTCRSREQYTGLNGGIRDVQWSPTDAVEFAFGTDNGTIQRWNYRNTKGPLQKITAHEQRLCTSIDWHPDGKHLLSASVDRTVKVWDFSTSTRRQKAVYVLQTPYPVYHARWRPPYWSDEHQEKGAYQATQIATSYDREHPNIHIWDFRRPYMPSREISRFKTAAMDMLWHSRDLLWTVGREGIFQQNDVHHAPKIVERRPLQALALSPQGEVGGVASKRMRPRFSSGIDYPEEGDLRDRRSSPGKPNSLRNSAEDSLDDGFLTSTMRQYHGRTSVSRAPKGFSTTPPSDAPPKVTFLNASLTPRGDSVKPDQLGFRGTLPGASSVQIFAYLAQKYKAIALSEPPDVDSFLELNRIFEQNAEYAQRAALYRLAQTWRMVGTSISIATKRRAELHRKQRLQELAAKPSVEARKSDIHDDIKSKPPTNPAMRAIMGLQDKKASKSSSTQLPTITESTSNLATPLARPTTDSSHPADEIRNLVLPDLDHEDLVPLPPALNTPPPKQGLTPDAAHSNGRAAPVFNGPQWYQSSEGLDERRALVGSYRASPRMPLRLGPDDTRSLSINVPPPLERHDSGESFTMFSASTDSQQGNSMPNSYASGKSLSGSTGFLSESWRAAQDRSSFGKPRGSVLLQKHQGLSKSVTLSPTARPTDIDQGANDKAASQGAQNIPLRDISRQQVDLSSGERALDEMQHLRRTNQLMRHDSSESEAYASSRAGTSTSSFEYSADMDASGTIVPDVFDDAESPPISKPPTSAPMPASSAPPVLEVEGSTLTLADFQAYSTDAEEDLPFPVVGLLNSLLAYHTNASDAQFSSLLLLLLGPLLPQTQSLARAHDVNAEEVLSTFADTFLSMGLTPTQAKAILSSQLQQLIATGINPYQAEAIIHSYHAQLHSLSLFNSAASLRRLAYPAYPAVYEQALKDTQLGLMCVSCKSPINNPRDKMRCESCKRAQASCPICWGRYPAFEHITAKNKASSKHRHKFTDKGHRHKVSDLASDYKQGPEFSETDASPTVPTNWSPPSATLWTWCSLCGHGGHTNCLSTWFANSALSDGACPTEGCLCDCVQGKRRDTKMQEVLLKKAEKERAKPVRKGDDWRVHESKAVSAVRTAALDENQMRQVNVDPQPPGGRGRKDENKRVRVLAPDTNAHSGGQIGPSPGSTFGKVPK